MGDAALKNDFLTEEEYLAGEELTEVWHEYVGGRVFAMSVPTDTHGEISGGIYSALFAHLVGKTCRPWMGNMRVRIAFLDRTIHYIPDVMVACDEAPRDRRFREAPLAIFEVVSESSEAIDQREKRLAYTMLPTLRHYFIVQQDRMEIAHVRRVGQDWEEFTLKSPEHAVEIPELDFTLSLATVYSAVGR
jgi:Uma2 family endonuclease